MPRKMPAPRSSSSPPPPRLPLPSLDLGIDWNPTISPAFQTPQLTFGCIATSANKKSSRGRTRERSEKSGVIAAWEEIRVRKSPENIGLGGKIKKGKKEGKEDKKPGKRTVSLQILPGSSTWSNLGLAQLRKSWTGGATTTDMKNITAVIEEARIKKPEERRSMRSRLRATSESKSTLGFGYEIYTPTKRMSKRHREPRPDESWLDLDDTPLSTLGKVNGGAGFGIRTPLSTFVTAPPITPPPERGRSIAPSTKSTGPPPPQPQTLKALIQTHLTTTLLSLEIDVAQLDTRLFLIFDQLRTVHTSLLLRIPGITAPVSPNNNTTLKRISNEEAKSRLQDLCLSLAGLETQLAGHFETVGVVQMQIGEALAEEDYIAEGLIEKIGEDTLRGAVELRRQIGQVKTELIRVERKRKGLEDWAAEVSMSWGFGGEEEEHKKEEDAAVVLSTKPQSAPVTPIKKLTFPVVSPEESPSQSQLVRNRSIRGSRSMATIASSKRSLLFPPNVNKPLPASPGDGDFAMETRYIRSRSKSPVPPLRREHQKQEEAQNEISIQPWEAGLLQTTSPSPLPPSIPPRNPRRIVPRTEPPHPAESDIGLALSVPPSSAPSIHQLRYSVATEETRLSLDLGNLDKLVIPRRNISSRSAREVYEDFFSMYDAGDDDDDEDDIYETGSMSQYSQDEHMHPGDEGWKKNNDYDNETPGDVEFVLPPLLPSIGPDSLFGGSNSSENSNKKASNYNTNDDTGDKTHSSLLTTTFTSSRSTQSESTSPTTPTSASTASNSPTSSIFSVPLYGSAAQGRISSYSTTTTQTTPYTPLTPTFNIHRKPLPSSCPEVPAIPASLPTPEVSPRMMNCAHFEYINTTTILPPISTQTPITPTSPTANTTHPAPNTPQHQFPFYSPSSFPHPPALHEVEQKVKRESMLRINESNGSNGINNEYPEPEIELLQCPPRGRGYTNATNASSIITGQYYPTQARSKTYSYTYNNTYVPPVSAVGAPLMGEGAIENASYQSASHGHNANGLMKSKGQGLLKRLKLRSGGGEKSHSGSGEWVADNTVNGNGMRSPVSRVESQGGFWKGSSSSRTSQQHAGVKIFAV